MSFPPPPGGMPPPPGAPRPGMMPPPGQQFRNPRTNPPPPGAPRFGSAGGPPPPGGGMPPPPGAPYGRPNAVGTNPQSGGLPGQMKAMSLGGGPPPPGQQPFSPPPPPGGGAGGPPPPAGMPGPPMPGAPTPGAPNPAFNGQPFGQQQAPPKPPAAPQFQSFQQPGGPAPPQPGFQPGPPQPGFQPGPPQQPGAPPGPGRSPGMQGQPGPPGPGAAPGQGQFAEAVDLSVQVPSRILRMTSTHVPATASMGLGAKVPLGAVIRPLAPCGPDEDDVPVVQPGQAGIVRCKRCRTYINAFVNWLENGRRWRCNICTQINDTSAPYFCHLDSDGNRRDRDHRPELSEGVVEFVAPSEYMVRPPQPPSYFFVIDVSAGAVQSGVLASVASAIRNSLDDLPGSPRTQVGFLTYDDGVHYYSMKSGLKAPQMLVVADLIELFVPAPDDLLVNLQDSREVVDVFLENLPTMFAGNRSARSCLGSALKAAFTVTKHIGGKMCVFQSTLPTLGDGALVPRENPSLMGTPDEIKLLRPGTNWYKETAVEFSRAQISVDMFLFPRSYIDVASLGELPKVTAGTLRTYPGFHPGTDGPRFESELERALVQYTAFEAVMRIRCTKGMRITNFYGNFFVRGNDLLALPNCNADSSFGFDLVHDEQNLTGQVVTVQAALLYTSSEGERRIRVITQALPVTSLASEVIGGADADAIAALLAKGAVDVGVKTSLDNARNKLQRSCAELIRASKEGDKPRTVSGYAAPPMQGAPGSSPGGEERPVPENLRLLPLYTLGLLKNVAFRGGTDVHPDERVHAMHRLTGMDVSASKHFVYPRMFAVHDMPPSAGLPSSGAPSDGDDDEGVAGPDRIELPGAVSLTVDRLTSGGVFLLDNGLDTFLWVGRSSDPSLLTSLFGMSSLEGADMGQIRLLTGGSDVATRLNSIVSALRDDGCPERLVPRVVVVREGDAGLESRFFWHLVEDPASFHGGTFSYADFVQFCESGGAQGPPGAPPPGHPGQQMGGPPQHNMGGPPGPPQNMGGPPQHMGGPPGPPQQMGGPPPPGPPQHNMGGPPPPGPPQQMMGGPPPPGPPQQMMGGPPPPGPPQQMMGGPPPPGPPQQMMGGPPPPGPPHHGMSPQRGPSSGHNMPPPMPPQQQMQPQQMMGGPPPPGSPHHGMSPPQRGPPSGHNMPPPMPPQQQMQGPPSGGMPPPPMPGQHRMQGSPSGRMPPPPMPGQHQQHMQGPPSGGMPPPPGPPRQQSYGMPPPPMGGGAPPPPPRR